MWHAHAIPNLSRSDCIESSLDVYRLDLAVLHFSCFFFFFKHKRPAVRSNILTAKPSESILPGKSTFRLCVSLKKGTEMLSRCYGAGVRPLTAHGLISVRFQSPLPPHRQGDAISADYTSSVSQRGLKHNTIILEQTNTGFQKREEAFKVYICDYHTFL